MNSGQEVGRRTRWAQGPMAGVKGSVPPEKTGPWGQHEGEAAQHRGPRQATCLHGASGPQESNCV